MSDFISCAGLLARPRQRAGARCLEAEDSYSLPIVTALLTGGLRGFVELSTLIWQQAGKGPEQRKSPEAGVGGKVKFIGLSGLFSIYRQPMPRFHAQH